jgi:hypothetical protein
MLLDALGVPVACAVNRKLADSAAREFVARQTRDRYRHLPQWVDESGLPILGLLTSFETYVELRRRAGLSQRQVVAHLQRAAAQLL